MSNRLTDSEEVVLYADQKMIPQLKGAEPKVVLAAGLYAPDFRRFEKYQSVTRDPDDTIVHDHDNHVLLMRSSETITDGTIICDFIEGLRALARAAVETDLLQKIDDHPEQISDQANECLENLQLGFSFLVQGMQSEVEVIMRKGHQRLRAEILQAAKYIDPKIRTEVYRTLVRGHHEIPSELRTVVEWDAARIDAMLIGAK